MQTQMAAVLMPPWLKENLWWISGLSIAILVIGTMAVFAVAIFIPANHFVRPPIVEERPTAARWIGRVVKNVTGVLLMVVGALLSLPLVPGPGLMILVIGLSMTDFPGKRKIEIWILRKPLLLSPINTVRRVFKREPLQMP